MIIQFIWWKSMPKVHGIPTQIVTHPWNMDVKWDRVKSNRGTYRVPTSSLLWGGDTHTVYEHDRLVTRWGWELFFSPLIRWLWREGRGSIVRLLRERVNKCFGGYMVIELCTKNIWVNWNDSPWGFCYYTLTFSLV